jgi:hypothetical protein
MDDRGGVGLASLVGLGWADLTEQVPPRGTGGKGATEFRRWDVSGAVIITHSSISD